MSTIQTKFTIRDNNKFDILVDLYVNNPSKLTKFNSLRNTFWKHMALRTQQIEENSQLEKEKSEAQGNIINFRHPHLTRQKGIHSSRTNSRCWYRQQNCSLSVTVPFTEKPRAARLQTLDAISSWHWSTVLPKTAWIRTVISRLSSLPSRTCLCRSLTKIWQRNWNRIKTAWGIYFPLPIGNASFEHKQILNNY